jgi:hypothetical protein
VITRKPDWETALAIYIDANLRTPFEWGVFDCCLFATNAVREITGTDLAAGFRDKYTNRTGALKQIAQYGDLQGLAEAIALINEIPEVGLLFASRGDVLLVAQTIEDEESLALAIVGMGVHGMGAGPGGLVEIERSAWLRAWKI